MPDRSQWPLAEGGGRRGRRHGPGRAGLWARWRQWRCTGRAGLGVLGAVLVVGLLLVGGVWTLTSGLPARARAPLPGSEGAARGRPWLRPAPPSAPLRLEELFPTPIAPANPRASGGEAGAGGPFGSQGELDPLLAPESNQPGEAGAPLGAGEAAPGGSGAGSSGAAGGTAAGSAASGTSGSSTAPPATGPAAGGSAGEGGADKAQTGASPGSGAPPAPNQAPEAPPGPPAGGPAGGAPGGPPAPSRLLRVVPEVGGDSVRVTLYLSGPTTYRLSTNPRPPKVVVDLAAQLDRLSPQIEVNDPFFPRVRIATGPDGGARVVLDFAYGVPEPQATFLPAPDRLVVEVPRSYGRRDEVEVAPGVRYGQVQRGTAIGPNLIHYIDVDLTAPGVRVAPVLAGPNGPERVSSMATRTGAVAGVNGVFYAANGRSLGLVAAEGRVLSLPIHDRTAFALFPGGRWFMGRVRMTGWAPLPDGSELRIAGLNRARRPGEVVAYTSTYGQSPAEAGAWAVALAGGFVLHAGPPPVAFPRGGYVLVGEADGPLALLRPGMPLSVNWELDPPELHDALLVMSGGPRLVAGGRVQVTGEEERFRSDITVGRAPRTALGVTPDGHLLLVTVSGRLEGVSVGMTLTELARLLIDLGARDAMNLDGGGSTTLVVRGRVRNIPSDGSERPVGSALLVYVEGVGASAGPSGGSGTGGSAAGGNNGRPASPGNGNAAGSGGSNAQPGGSGGSARGPSAGSARPSA